MAAISREVLISYGLVFLTCIFGIALLATGIRIMFGVESYSTYKKRQRQLNTYRKRSDTSNEVTIDTITKPIIEHIISKFKFRKMRQLEKDLAFVGWDKDFTAEQFKALQILGAIVGIFVGLLLLSIEENLIAGIVCAAGLFLPGFLLKSEKNDKETKLLSSFPDFVRIIQGYLTIEQPFVTCVENSLKFVGPEWRVLLEEFIVLCNTRSVEDALGWLQNQIDIFEVREFLTMVKLSLEQGGTVRDSFEEQATKVNEILHDLIRIKVEKRRVMGIVVQAPLLLSCFLVFGLPIFYEFFNLNL